MSPPGEGWQIFWYTMGLTGLGVALFFVIRLFARPAPRTMTKEWQEKTNEYLKVQIPGHQTWQHRLTDWSRRNKRLTQLMVSPRRAILAGAL